MIEIIGAIIAGLLGGSAVAALVNAIAAGIRQRREHKYNKTDGKDKNIEALKAGLKWLIYGNYGKYWYFIKLPWWIGRG